MTFKYLKKLLFIQVIVFILFVAINFTVHAEGEIKYLTASVGESYNEVGINYHCNVDNSYIIYGTTLNGSEIENPIRVDSVSTLWKLDQVGEDTQSGFSERYICKANLTHLKANTTYYYQAVSNDVKSSIQSFTTASNDNSDKSFMFLTDIQSVGSSFKNAENLIQSILNSTDSPNPNLVVMTGDQVDRGGYEQQWIDYYNYVPSLGNFLQATIPGNHEYYFSSNGSYISNEIYNQFYNNPTNGPIDRLGSSYYFVWDQILFIMLDTVKTDYNVAQQQEWFRNVVKNNPTQWIIVGSHPGLYATGAYDSDAQIMRRNWLDLFEECQVDIALNGHEHVYARKNLRYNGNSNSPTAGEKNEALGITYLQGGAAGLKNYGGQSKPSLLEDYDYVNKTATNTGVLFTLTGNELKVELYTAAGKVIDNFTLTAKRPTSIEKISDQEILDAFDISYDEQTSSVSINWDGKIYGNVASLKFTGGNLNEMGQEIAISTNKLTSKSWSGYYTDYNYEFQVEITKVDGLKLYKTLPLILNLALLDYEIVYNLDGGTNHPDNPSKFTGTSLPIDLTTFLKNPTKDGYLFDGWVLDDNEDVTDTIPTGTYHDIVLKATWKKAPYSITYELMGGTNSKYNPQNFYMDELPLRLSKATKDGYIFKGWSLNGTIITEIPTNTNSNIVLTAVWEEETYKIIYSLNGGKLPSDAPTEYSLSNKPTLPTPTKDGYIFKGWTLNGEQISSIPTDAKDTITLSANWEKESKKGCKKNSAAQINISISLLVGTILILRKKH